MFSTLSVHKRIVLPSDNINTMKYKIEYIFCSIVSKVPWSPSRIEAASEKAEKVYYQRETYISAGRGKGDIYYPLLS